jgi:hypothetical protein
VVVKDPARTRGIAGIMVKKDRRKRSIGDFMSHVAR